MKSMILQECNRGIILTYSVLQFVAFIIVYGRIKMVFYSMVHIN